ncbi:unnamed protein product [Calicophoron daubneyi]|uniref:RMT2 domain-containing protein n=1 Tax=Calicophoron daubneyi TaxID=300641 RepID=A0AAV2TTN3_CALDB
MSVGVGVMTPEEFSLNPYDLDLVLACDKGEFSKVEHLVEVDGADICYQDPKTGISVLMVAASQGHEEIVRYLLAEGAPWNAVDKSYMCAGDYAAKHGHQKCVDLLLDHAVMSELLLSITLKENTNQIESAVFSPSEQRQSGLAPESLNASYLNSRLEYSTDGERLVDTSTHLAVMMDWEQPLMARHAAWICRADQKPRPQELRILNVGFGMGIVDKEIQTHSPSSHVIIEAHPEVLKRMEENGWMSKSGVQVLKGRWQDAVHLLSNEIAEGTVPPFDGIFFDTYAEDDLDLREFHSWLPKLLRLPKEPAESEEAGAEAGRYSYYNGVCPDNVFFHGVACETIRLHLKRLGIECTFEPIPVDVSDPKLWENLSQRYWHFDTYFLPKCTFQGPK